MKKLLKPFDKQNLKLKNHIVMAPMTRTRAIGNVPNALMAKYYGQRTGAGLIITEGTAPVANALGYPNIPGVFNQQQIEGWKLITEKVHKDGTKIFLQLMHTGRIGHVDSLPENAILVAPSDKTADGEIFTTGGMKPHSKPKALSSEDIQDVIEGFVKASKNAIEAGFDGVELHGANGYLIEQFLNPNVNTREDQYGGSVENRIRFVVEVTSAVADAIGKDKVGIRLSPFSNMGDLADYPEQKVQQTYALLASEFEKLGIAYIHVAVNAEIPKNTFKAIRDSYKGTIILCNGLTPETGEKALHEEFADLVAYGKSFLANPDFVTRIEKEAPFNEADPDTFYGVDEKGYTDYPTL